MRISHGGGEAEDKEGFVTEFLFVTQISHTSTPILTSSRLRTTGEQLIVIRFLLSWRRKSEEARHRSTNECKEMKRKVQLVTLNLEVLQVTHISISSFRTTSFSNHSPIPVLRFRAFTSLLFPFPFVFYFWSFFLFLFTVVYKHGSISLKKPLTPRNKGTAKPTSIPKN